MDHILATGTPLDKHKLKARFGLEEVKHDDDFMYYIGMLGPGTWQSQNLAADLLYMDFCNHVENSVHVKDPTKLPGPEGVGLDKAMDGYSKYVQTQLPIYKDFFCKGASMAACFGTHSMNDLQYRDTTVSNKFDRQWIWMLCNEPFEWLRTAPPDGQPTLISRLVDREYYVRQW
jgi:hypothetical protein